MQGCERSITLKGSHLARLRQFVGEDMRAEAGGHIDIANTRGELAQLTYRIGHMNAHANHGGFEASWHSHPEAVYKACPAGAKQVLAMPSPSDIFAALYQHIHNPAENQVHLVPTREGVYAIDFTPAYVAAAKPRMAESGEFETGLREGVQRLLNRYLCHGPGVASIHDPRASLDDMVAAATAALIADTRGLSVPLTGKPGGIIVQFAPWGHDLVLEGCLRVRHGKVRVHTHHTHGPEVAYAHPSSDQIELVNPFA